jgi:hypothetical protein
MGGQISGLDMFLALVRDSVASKGACARANLTTSVLAWFRDARTDDLQQRLASLLEVCGAHSLSGSDLRRVFMLLRALSSTPDDATDVTDGQ